MSSRFFLYLGLGLIFLALIFLPAKVRFVVQPDVGETELWHVGPIFTFLIGIWSLPSLLLGAIESSASKKAVLLPLTLILCFVNVVLAGLLWDAASFWHSMLIQWLINYSPFLAPCLIVDVATFLYFTKEVKFTTNLKSPKIRVLSIIVLTAAPLWLAAILLYMWLATVF
ncbi:MAG: hypothetical protein QXH37_02465 [Candidatus Bathyarchaeia archaeon]